MHKFLICLSHSKEIPLLFDLTQSIKFCLVSGMTIRLFFNINIGVFGVAIIKCRVGAHNVDFQIPEALKRYSSDNFTSGVDNMDKDRKI